MSAASSDLATLHLTMPQSRRAPRALFLFCLASGAGQLQAAK
jgi:hypothetical protein